jgi:hypothetical protein
MPLDLASPKQDLCTPLVKNGLTTTYHGQNCIFIDHEGYIPIGLI